MSSIMTNTAAMTALQTMRGIGNDLGTVQNQISTGLKVDTAADNAAVWAISSTMNADIDSMESVQSALSLGESTAAVARDASEQISGIIGEMKELVLDAGENVDNEKIESELEAKMEQIQSITESASFNGKNLIEGNDEGGAGEDEPQAADALEVMSSVVRTAGDEVSVSSITVSGADLRSETLFGYENFEDLDDFDGDTGGSLNFGADAGDRVDLNGGDAETIDAMFQALDAAQNTVDDAAAAFGSAQTRLGGQEEFVSNLKDALTEGVGALVDADMTEASARLQALQVQEQLATQSLGIANQQPQNLLSLFG